jgi:hypothetical protein
MLRGVHPVLQKSMLRGVHPVLHDSTKQSVIRRGSHDELLEKMCWNQDSNADPITLLHASQTQTSPTSS